MSILLPEEPKRRPKKHHGRSIAAFLAALTASAGLYLVGGNRSAEKSSESKTSDRVQTKVLPASLPSLPELEPSNVLSNAEAVLAKTPLNHIRQQILNIDSDLPDERLNLITNVLNRLTTDEKEHSSAFDLQPKTYETLYTSCLRHISNKQLRYFIENKETEFSFAELKNALTQSEQNPKLITEEAYLLGARYRMTDRAFDFLPDTTHEDSTDYFYFDINFHPTIDAGINVDANTSLLPLRVTLSQDAYKILYTNDVACSNYATNQAYSLTYDQLKTLTQDAQIRFGKRKNGKLYNPCRASATQKFYDLTVVSDDLKTVEDFRRKLIVADVKKLEKRLNQKKPEAIKDASGLFGTVSHPVPTAALDALMDFAWQRPNDDTVDTAFKNRNWIGHDGLNNNCHMNTRSTKPGSGLIIPHQATARQNWIKTSLTNAQQEISQRYRRELFQSFIQPIVLGEDSETPQKTEQAFLRSFFDSAYRLAQTNYYKHSIFEKDRQEAFQDLAIDLTQIAFPHLASTEPQKTQNLVLNMLKTFEEEKKAATQKANQAQTQKSKAKPAPFKKVASISKKSR